MFKATNTPSWWPGVEMRFAKPARERPVISRLFFPQLADPLGLIIRAVAASSSRLDIDTLRVRPPGYFDQRALEVHGPTTPALAMGDFNDEQFDTSLVTHALSTRQRRKVLNADNPLFFGT